MVVASWHLPICLLALTAVETGCLSLAIREGKVRSMVFDRPVPLADVSEDKSLVVSPYVVVSGNPRFAVTEYLGDDDSLDPGGRGESMRWSTPAIRLGSSIEYPLNRNLSVTGSAGLGRAEGELVWSGSGALGLNLPLELVAMPEGAALRIDLGVRAKRSAFSIHYEERYTRDDSTTSASGQFSDTDVTVDGFVSATFNPATLSGYTPFVGAEAAVVPFMHFDLESVLTDLDHHDVNRHAGTLSIIGGVVREFGYAAGALGLEIFIQLDHLVSRKE